MIFDHVGYPVTEMARSLSFYKDALKPLGLKVIVEVQGWVGMGTDRPQFWFGQGDAGPKTGLHIAFAAKSRAEVRAFYDAALAAGGRDNGAPGVRAVYHPNYYGAFVLDPDGHNVEAVCHLPE